VEVTASEIHFLSTKGKADEPKLKRRQSAGAATAKAAGQRQQTEDGSTAAAKRALSKKVEIEKTTFRFGGPAISRHH